MNPEITGVEIRQNGEHLHDINARIDTIYSVDGFTYLQAAMTLLHIAADSNVLPAEIVIDYSENPQHGGFDWQRNLTVNGKTILQTYQDGERYWRGTSVNPIGNEEEVTAAVQDIVYRTKENIRGAQIEALEDAAHLIATEFHEDWRMSSHGIYDEDGELIGFTPRVKCLVERENKQCWVNEDQLSEDERILFSQDIANTEYDDLDPHWQADNLAAAHAVVELMVVRKAYFGEEIDLSNSQHYHWVGTSIHDAWLSRNEWAYNDPELGVPFDQLSPEEAAKDIRQMEIALEMLGYKSLETSEA